MTPIFKDSKVDSAALGDKVETLPKNGTLRYLCSINISPSHKRRELMNFGKVTLALKIKLCELCTEGCLSSRCSGNTGKPQALEVMSGGMK